MRKLKYKNKLFACLLLLASVCNAKEFRCDEINSTVFQEGLNTYFNKFTVYEIPLTAISDYVMQNSSDIKFDFIIGNETFALNLELNDMRGKNFKAVMMTEEGAVEMPQDIANTYKGTVNKDESNFTRFTIDKSIFEGYINRNGKRYFIDQLSRYFKNASANYVVLYEPADVKPDNNNVCGSNEINEEKKQLIEDDENVNLNRMLTGTCKFLEIATEADYEYYQAYGSASVALNRIRTILNLVEGFYTGPFKVKFVLNYQSIWTNIVDPYSGTTLQLVKDQFRDWWNTNRTNVSRDVTHMFTGASLPATPIGIARTASVCDDDEYYGVVKNFSTVNNYTVNLSVHELGHNIGATHIVPCNNTIMCKNNSNSSLWWGSQSLSEISNYIASNSCMDETFSNTTAVIGLAPYSYVKALGINSVIINSALSPVEITNGGFAYFEAGNEIVITPTIPNTTGFIANTGSVVLMRISDLSNTCLPLAKEADTNYPMLKDAVLSLYPNPANDFITVKMNNADSKTSLKIYNSTMQLVKSANVENSLENKISTSDLSPGIYLLIALSENETYKEKFVIAR